MPLYFLKVVLLFWVPGVALTIGLWKYLKPTERWAFLVTGAIMAAVSFVMEYVYLWADIWNFSEARDPLLGIRLWGAPIEEFGYWFGATPFVLSIYLLLRRFLTRTRTRTRRRGRLVHARR